MSRLRFPNLVLAAALALLLPVEQAHCAFMGLERHGCPVGTNSPAGHECCDAPPASQPNHHSQPEKTPQGCICEQLPAGALPAALKVGIEAPLVASVAVLTVPTVVAPVSIVAETVPALDVGRPPLPDDPGAHGLRAPPFSS